jgi:hypothetical protein
MNTPAFNQVRNEARALSEPDRAAPAHDMNASPDGPSHLNASEWDAEIPRLLKRIDAGAVQFVDRVELKCIMRQHLASK